MWTYRCTKTQQILVNEVKLCTLKVQRDVQLVMAKFCWSIKDCQSQASFNDSTIKGLGPKRLAYRIFPSGGTWGSPSRLCAPPPRPCPTTKKFPENNSLPTTTLSLHQGLVPPQKFPENKRDNNSLLF